MTIERLCHVLVKSFNLWLLMIYIGHSDGLPLCGRRPEEP